MYEGRVFQECPGILRFWATATRRDSSFSNDFKAQHIAGPMWNSVSGSSGIGPALPPARFAAIFTFGDQLLGHFVALWGRGGEPPLFFSRRPWFRVPKAVWRPRKSDF